MNTVRNITHKRLMGDIKLIKQNPIPGMHLEFDPENLLVWYYIIEGSEGTPFHGGFYFGRIELPENYPWSPPTVVMKTPSGRFKADKPICFSYTNFHPETWNPALNPQKVALGLVSYMNDLKEEGWTCMITSESGMKRLALSSLEFNLNNPIVQSMFPDVVTVMKEKLESLIAD